jgi:hypothetical protein
MAQTHDHSIYRLGWGDGYFKGHEEDQLGNEQLQRGGVEEEDQLLRKEILSELNAIVGDKDQDDASASPGADYVCDTEWFYLVSLFISTGSWVCNTSHSLPLDSTLDQSIDDEI